MPYGSFLDSMPSMLFITAHVAFLLVGAWAATTAAKAGKPFASILWLYAISQIGFLAFFGGAVTMKMAVLVEQMLMVAVIAVVASKK